MIIDRCFTIDDRYAMIDHRSSMMAECMGTNFPTVSPRTRSASSTFDTACPSPRFNKLSMMTTKRRHWPPTTTTLLRSTAAISSSSRQLYSPYLEYAQQQVNSAYCTVQGGILPIYIPIPIRLVQIDTLSSALVVVPWSFTTTISFSRPWLSMLSSSDERSARDYPLSSNDPRGYPPPSHHPLIPIPILQF